MDYNDMLRKIKFGIPVNGKQSTYIDVGLTSTSDSLAAWLAQTFNHNFDAYDSAIDYVYNTTRIGGPSYHHLFDGQHDILGAFRAVKDVSADDSLLKELSEAGEHLLRDTASISGINPFFSLSPDQFNSLAKICANMGISKPYLVDMLTINGPELIGGSLGLVSSLLLAKKQDFDNLSSLSGAYIVSSLSTANPLLLPVAALGLVHSLSKSPDKKDSLIRAGKGSIVSGSAIFTTGLIGGPVWISCVTAITTAMIVRYSLDNPEGAFKKAQSIIKPANIVLNKVFTEIARG